MKSEVTTSYAGLPQLKVWDDKHIPYAKHFGQDASLFAEFTANPSDNGNWLQLYLHETNKGRTRTVSLCLSGAELEQLRELLARIPAPAEVA